MVDKRHECRRLCTAAAELEVDHALHALEPSDESDSSHAIAKQDEFKGESMEGKGGDVFTGACLHMAAHSHGTPGINAGQNHVASGEVNQLQLPTC